MDEYFRADNAKKLAAIKELIGISKEAEMLLTLGKQVNLMVDLIKSEGDLSIDDILKLQDMSKEFGDCLEKEEEKRKRIECKRKEEEKQELLKNPDNWKPEL